MSDGRLRVLMDGTPLLGQRTGIGRYTAALAEELASMSDVDIRAVAFTLRGWRALRFVLPHGVWARGLPCSARVLRKCWLRSSFPPVELIAGFADAVHGTNFVLPVPAHAGGVLTIHDLGFLDAPDELPPSDRELPELVRRSASRADVVCTPTQAVARAVVARLDVPEDRIAVTPLGVDPAWFAALPPADELRKRLGLPSEYLLFLGADGPRKGLRYLRKAHESVPSLPPLTHAVTRGFRFLAGHRAVLVGIEAVEARQRGGAEFVAGDRAVLVGIGQANHAAAAEAARGHPVQTGQPRAARDTAS